MPVWKSTNIYFYTWWRHQMETFSALPAICAGNSPVTGEVPAQRPMTRSFDVFFDLRLNKQLSKQSWGWWFGTLSRPLWRRCNWIGVTALCIPTIQTWNFEICTDDRQMSHDITNTWYFQTLRIVIYNSNQKLQNQRTPSQKSNYGPLFVQWIITIELCIPYTDIEI